jgi:hypothetical protein
MHQRNEDYINDPLGSAQTLQMDKMVTVTTDGGPTPIRVQPGGDLWFDKTNGSRRYGRIMPVLRIT